MQVRQRSGVVMCPAGSASSADPLCLQYLKNSRPKRHRTEQVGGTPDEVQSVTHPSRAIHLTAWHSPMSSNPRFVWPKPVCLLLHSMLKGAGTWPWGSFNTTLPAKPVTQPINYPNPTTGTGLARDLSGPPLPPVLAHPSSIYIFCGPGLLITTVSVINLLLYTCYPQSALGISTTDTHKNDLPRFPSLSLSLLPSFLPFLPSFLLIFVFCFVKQDLAM